MVPYLDIRVVAKRKIIEKIDELNVEIQEALKMKQIYFQVMSHY